MSGGSGSVGAATAPAAFVNAPQQKGVPDYQQGYIDSFFTQVLIDAGLPVNGTNIAVLKAQTRAEGSKATYNPLDLENAAQNKVVPQYNTQGVSNFSSGTQGAAATARVLLQSNMAAFRKALAGNTGTSGTVDPLAAAQTAKVGLGGSDWLGGGSGSSANQAYGSRVADLVSNNYINTQNLGPTALEQVAMGPVGTAAQDASNVVGTNPLAQVGALLGDFTSVSFWIRIGLVVVGFVLLVVGIKALAEGGQSKPSDGPVDKVAKAGAVAAA